MSTVARPRTLSFKWEETPHRLSYDDRTGSIGGGLFLTFWLCGWSVGCVFLSVHVWQDPKPFNFLFAVPFWASWVFAVVMTLAMFFGRETVELTAEGLSWRRWSPGFGKSRFVPTAELIGVDESYGQTSENGHQSVHVQITTVGLPVTFGVNLGQRERHWLMQQLQERIAELQAQLQITAESDEIARYVYRRRASGGELPPDEVERTIDDPPSSPPSDTTYSTSEDFDAVEFVRRGTLKLEALGGVLFINLFWNGIVSVFVYGLIFGDENGNPQGAGRIGLGVFLIPFVAIGLVMMVILAATLFAPYHRYRLRFSRQEFTTASTWFGIGRDHSTSVSNLDRIEVERIDDAKERVKFSIKRMSNLTSPDVATYTLALIDRNTQELGKVDGLSLGEAQWMADTVLRARREWFL